MNRILAIPAEAAAIPPNPRTPAISARVASLSAE